MFPYIAGKQRGGVVFYRAAGIAFLNNFKFPVLLFNQPGPARAEQRGSGSGEFFTEIGE